MAQAPLSRPLRMHWIGNALMAIASLAAGAMLITSYFMKLSPHAALLHGDPVDRVQAVEELIKLGRRGVPDLVHALKNDNREIRLSALFGLGRIGPQASDAISSVRHALTDPDPAVRSIATGTFWQIHRDPREAVAILLQMLTDSHEDVRQSAVRTLEEIGATNTELLVELIRTQSDQIRTQLWPILRKVSNHGTTPGIANSVRELLDHSNPTIHNEALLSIVSWDQASVDEIRELLKLGATNFEGSPTNDRGSAAVDVALRAILMQGPDAVEFLPEVLERLDQHSPAEVVVFVGTPQPLFQEDSYEIHDQFQILLKILGQMQTAARPAVPLLVRRLDEFHPENRIPVTQALVEIGSDPEFVVSVLVPFLSKQVSEGDFSKTSVKLRERTRQAAGILIRADPEQARQQIALLIPQLENPETGINKSALNILAGFGAALAPADADLLIPLVGHPDREIRHLAIETLSGMGTAASAAIPALLDQLGGDPFTQDPEKNRRIIRTFGQIGTAAKAAVPALLDVVELGVGHARVGAAGHSGSRLRVRRTVGDSVARVRICCCASDRS